MTKHSSHVSHTRHRARCEFVPPFVLDHLARDDREEVRAAALATAHEATASRNRRAEQEVTLDQRAASAGLEEIAAAPSPTGNAAREVYDCQNQYVKRVELVRREGANPTGDADADVLYDHVGTTRDFLKNKLSRNSLDGLGLDLILNAHYGVKTLNAFWDGKEMIFGDGDGERFVGFAKSLDVVAHEMGHGVTQYTAGLEYHGETGALNEHFSDVLGTVITQAFHGETADTADWLIGDEVMGPELKGEAMRSMRAPGTAHDNRLIGTDPQPAHINGYYHGSLDNHGVHINSGIPNRAFYLVATELGDTLAAGRIWYEALKRLTPRAGFSDAAEVIASIARAFTNAGKLPKGAAQIVRAAFAEVGILKLDVARGVRAFR